jgi:murein DD-endopeptidase MepM/ murein hydrolase activator NlpD
MRNSKQFTLKWVLLIALGTVLVGCSMPATTMPSIASTPLQVDKTKSPEPSDLPTLPSTRSSDDLAPLPTSENGVEVDNSQQNSFLYTVQLNDTLGLIAQEFGIEWEDLARYNQLSNPNALEIGQVLLIPGEDSQVYGPETKLIPDSELVFGPAAVYLDVRGFSEAQGGYLAVHRDSAEGKMMDGIDMVIKVATEYSVNPKILLTLLEYASGWVRDSNPRTSTLEFPLGKEDSRRIGLYAQLAWAADQLNEGYYLSKAGINQSWFTQDGSQFGASPSLNAGTVALQGLMADIHNEDEWRRAISSDGFLATYQLLFGYPFDFAIEPQFPDGLTQPSLQLPFEDEVPWVFTGGPHAAWGFYAAQSALDFAPRGDQLGCWMSADWVVAAADGLIIRSDDGAVVQDLDGDGIGQTGWSILYMHMAEYERVAVGTYVEAGERIGHPSCEGGLASASHLHLARRYNGEWIPAYGDLAFNLDGWISVSDGIPYEGWMENGDQLLEACECYDPAFMLER